MSDVDTAAIRAKYEWATSKAGWVVMDLCDALDAARAERDNRKMWHGDTAAIRAGVVDNPALAMTILDLCDALDAATAEVREWKARSDLNVLRAEAAEARIAAALALCDIYAGNETLAYYMPEIRRALTGGTE